MRKTNVVLPDIIVDEDVITVPMPAPDYVEEEDVPVVIQNQSQEYYNQWYAQEEDVPVAVEPQEYYYNIGESSEQMQYDYVQPQGYVVPQEYDNQYQYSQDDVVYEEDVPVPTTQRHLSIHDGGQYSVTYEETEY